LRRDLTLLELLLLPEEMIGLKYKYQIAELNENGNLTKKKPLIVSNDKARKNT
jgi:hypothetical protein